MTNGLGDLYIVLPVVASVKLFFACSLAYRLWLGRGASGKLRRQGRLGESNPGQSISLDLNSSPATRFQSFICVQLPLYNETGLVHGLLASIVKLDWPHDRLAVQILDDSDDPECISETSLALSKARDDFPNLDIALIRRTRREGFKAGALNEGTWRCPMADFFAIFDADFRPEPDFLKRLHAEFEHQPEIACVQAGWSYENSSESMLTRLQETLLNIHFHNDHFGRNRRGWVVNFNGTAGMWRKSALDALGGWSAASVTEDLLLSYKAELMGMRVRYVDSLRCDSQLPSSVNSFLIQQRRWSRGHAQVLRQVRREVLRKRDWSIFKKFDAIFHLHSYSISLVIATTLILAPAWIIERNRWIQATPGTDVYRIVELALWLVVGVLFFTLFSNRFANSSAIDSREKSGNRFSRLMSSFSRGLVVFLSSPYLSLFMLDSFVRGLLDSGRDKTGLVFHRTPKNHSLARRSQSMALHDKMAIVALALTLLGLAVLSGMYEQWLAAVVFASQGVFVPLWLVRREWYAAPLFPWSRLPR
jgi:cellulose synthase/poly-beta-1,6-N-acetylglucosamine synthase-like glycosyltransferase